MKWKHDIPRMGTYLWVTSGQVSPCSKVVSWMNGRSGEQKHMEDTTDQLATTHGGNPPLRVYSKTWCSLAPITAQQGVTSQSSRSGQPAPFHLGETVWPNFGKRMGIGWNQRLKILHAMEYSSAMRKNETMPTVAIWIQLEMATASEGSHRKTSVIWRHSRVI